MSTTDNNNDNTSDQASTSLANQREDSKKEVTNTVSLYKLFAFADSKDKILMIIGTIGAIGNGLSLPLMTILFGGSLGGNQRQGVVAVVSGAALKFVYLTLGCGAAAFLQVACWMITGERQAARIRSLYLKTILRQDVLLSLTNTGEVVGRMSGDTVLIQDAMGEKMASQGQNAYAKAAVVVEQTIGSIRTVRLSLMLLHLLGKRKL